MPATPDVAVLINPRSGKVRRRIARVRALARRMAGDRCVEASDPDAMASFVAAAPGEGGVLCVAGGDGSVQAVLTALERERPDGAWPILAAAPGGTTNMTARDLGERVKLTAYMRRLARWVDGGAGGRLVPRAVLRIGRPGRPPVAGMFLGAGTVAAGVDLFHRSFRPRGIPEAVASPLIAGRILASLARRGTPPADLAPPVTLEVDGAELADRRALFLFASTLHRHILGARPYWGTEDGPIHTTLVEGRVRWGLRHIPLFARGIPGPHFPPEEGWHSHNAHRLLLTLEGPWIVDGEVYHARASDGPLEITARRVAEWWVP